MKKNLEALYEAAIPLLGYLKKKKPEIWVTKSFNTPSFIKQPKCPLMDTHVVRTGENYSPEKTRPDHSSI